MVHKQKTKDILYIDQLDINILNEEGKTFVFSDKGKYQLELM